MSSTPLPTCFIAMPITTHPDEAGLYGDPDHWTHVIEHLFVPAVEKAGFRAIRPTASGTSMIHGRIVQHLVEADMVLCDLSQHNPNVFFELGVRTSLNKPVALVKDEHLRLPFDTSGLNTLSYSSKLDVWKVEEEIDALVQHIRDSVAESAGKNPMWERFGVAISADRPTEDLNPTEARIELLVDRLSGLEERFERGVDGPIGELQAAGDEWLITNAISTVEGVLSVNFRGTVMNGARPVTIRTTTSSPEVQVDRIRSVAEALHRGNYAVDVEHSDEDMIMLRILRRPRSAGTWHQLA